MALVRNKGKTAKGKQETEQTQVGSHKGKVQKRKRLETYKRDDKERETQRGRTKEMMNHLNQRKNNNLI